MFCLCMSEYYLCADIGGARKSVGSPETEVTDGVRLNMGYGK